MCDTGPCHTLHLRGGRLRSDQSRPQSPSRPRAAGETPACQGSRRLPGAQLCFLAARRGRPKPGTAVSDLLSFICVYRGCGSGSWSLTSKLAPGSWKRHGCCREWPSQAGRRGLPWAPSQGARPPPPPAHIIACQVWVVLLDAVVQDGDHNAAPRVTLGPGLLHVQVPLGDARLWRHPPPSPDTYEIGLTG